MKLYHITIMILCKYVTNIIGKDMGNDKPLAAGYLSLKHC